MGKRGSPPVAIADVSGPGILATDSWCRNPFSISDIRIPAWAGQKNAIALQEKTWNEEPFSAAVALFCRRPADGKLRVCELDAATFHGHKERNEWLHSKASKSMSKERP